MISLYNSRRELHPLLQWAISILCGAAYYVCCLPSFNRIGAFFWQTGTAALLSVLVTAVVFFLVPRSLRIIGRGLSLFLMLMLFLALQQQVAAHIKSGSFQLRWIYTFFYDRIYTVCLVWFVPFFLILMLRLLLPFSDALAVFRKDFASFFKLTMHVFLVFYAGVLVYSFLLQRQPYEESGFNLIPFVQIAEYFRSMSYLYESIFYLLGNILCFFPLGFYMAVIRRDLSPVHVIVLPIVLSLLIEVSQFLLKTGHFDVDDIIMNAAGFYIGYEIKHLFDLIRTKRTKGEEQTIFPKPATSEA